MNGVLGGVQNTPKNTVKVKIKIGIKKFPYLGYPKIPKMFGFKILHAKTTELHMLPY